MTPPAPDGGPGASSHTEGEGRSGSGAAGDWTVELPAEGTGVRAARLEAKAASVAPAGRATTPVDRNGTGPRPAVAPPGGGDGPTRRWLTVFGVALTVCMLAGAVLTFVGVETLRDSRTGRTVSSADPDEPGFEGFLEPTPTLVVLDTRNTNLVSVALLSLGSDDVGGSVVLIPVSTTVGDGTYGTLEVARKSGSTPEDIRRAVEVVTGVGVQESVPVDEARWAQLVAPVAPLIIDNPDPIEGFGEGSIALAATDVGRWMAALDDGESETARVYRQQLFWEAWLDAVSRADSIAAVPGELDAGVGRFVRGLAAGTNEVSTLPVTPTTNDDDRRVFEVDRDEARAVVTRAVPFPTGTPSAPRTLVRLLDGTGDGSHVTQVAPQVVVAEASIVVVGNANSFDYTATEIRYHQPDQRAAAERLRDALGTGEVTEDVRPIDSFDVTIVLGTDV